MPTSTESQNLLDLEPLEILLLPLYLHFKLHLKHHWLLGGLLLGDWEKPCKLLLPSLDT